jgi:hypothetical protein
MIKNLLVVSFLVISTLWIVPLAQAETVYMEAEDFEEKNPAFQVIPFGESSVNSSGGLVIQLQINQIEKYRISYHFSIIQSGLYKVWAAATPPNAPWASPYLVGLKKVGGEESSGVEADAYIKKSGLAYGGGSNASLFQWFLFMKKPLEEGGYELTFEVSKPQVGVDPNNNNTINFFLDSIFITSEDIEPEGPSNPISQTVHNTP